MKTDEKLALELVWQPDGHVTDVVVTAVADGQTQVVPEDAMGHLRRCESCADRLGEAALWSLAVGHAVQDFMQRRRTGELATQPWPVPIVAVAVALVFLALGAVPLLAEAPLALAHMFDAAHQVVPQLVSATVAFVRAGGGTVGPSFAVVMACAAAVLVATSIGVARLVPRHALVSGGAS